MHERVYACALANFHAARKVGILPDTHPASKLHGHNFTARTRVLLDDEWVKTRGNEVNDLQVELKKAVEPFDYSYLNEIISIPTDENLSRSIIKNISLKSIESLGVASTRNQGADLESSSKVHVWKRFQFDAAHQLPNVHSGHKCGRMHGHGFEVVLHAIQDIKDKDMGVDFDYLEEIWKPLKSELHQKCLNDIKGLENPTSEMLSTWIWNRLKPNFEQLSWVTVYETVTAGCHYDGEHYRIWKEQRFESALSLNENKKDSLHGHSYLIRLHLSCPLDEVMGWTMDYGDVKEIFKPTLSQLDHYYLNEVEGIKDVSLPGLTGWIKDKLESELSALDRIDLFESPFVGVAHTWGDKGPALPI